MSAVITIDNQGLINMLRALPQKVQNTIAKKATIEIARPILHAAESNVKQDTGTLHNALGLRIKIMPRKGRIRVSVGPRKGMATTDERGRVRNAVRYAHLVEFGTSAHGLARKSPKNKQRNNSQHPGAKAQPFMTPAFQSQAPSSLAKQMAVATKEIEREAKKAFKGGGK
jgi:HK97 gp10 family phage protein